MSKLNFESRDMQRLTVVSGLTVVHFRARFSFEFCHNKPQLLQQTPRASVESRESKPVDAFSAFD
jgi:hypothetical protein